MTICYRVLLPLLLAVFARSAVAATIDEQGNYHLSYIDAGGRPAEYIFVPRNKVVPSIQTVLSDGFEYTYKVSNAVSARQGISIISFIVPSPAGIVFGRTNPMFGEAAPGFGFRFANNSEGLAIDFSSIYPVDVAAPPVTIRPGQTSSFKITVPYLAGIVEAKVFGYVPFDRCALEACSAVLDDQGNEIEYPDLDAQLYEYYDLNVPVLIAAPLLTGKTVATIKSELSRWPDLGQCSPSFIVQATSRLDALASAVNFNNKASANASLEEFNAFLTTVSQADLSPLGAQILRFDLAAVVRAFE